MYITCIRKLLIEGFREKRNRNNANTGARPDRKVRFILGELFDKWSCKPNDRKWFWLDGIESCCVGVEGSSKSICVRRFSPSALSLFRFHLSPFPQKRLILRLGRQGADLWQMVSSVFYLSDSPFALFFSLLWNFSGRFTEGTVLVYKNRTTGRSLPSRVPDTQEPIWWAHATPIFLEGKFAACNFRVANKSSSHTLWVAQYIQRTKRSVRPPGGALGYFLGGYVPPGTPNWHPVLKKIPLKLIARFRNGPIFIRRSRKFVNWNSPVFLKRYFFICSTYTSNKCFVIISNNFKQKKKPWSPIFYTPF